MVGSVLAGSLWGMAGIATLGRGSLPAVLLAFVIGGMTAGAAGTHATHLPAFFGFAIP